MFLLAQKILVTAALPYANAKLHLGHLRSTYIPADIYARFLRLRGYDALYVCATDEHGTPIAVGAEKEGITPKQIADKYRESIREDLKNVGCSFDVFARTTSQLHYELTQRFFERLLENGYIYEAEHEQLFCPKCKRFLPDRYVEGTCPYCGTEGARGDACEGCGRYLKPTELEKPYCVMCGATPEVRKTRHCFFKLSAFQEFLREWIEKNKELPANVKNYALQWLHEGLRDWCVTRDLRWGVPVPVEREKEKVIYVWFDAPIGYISSTKEWAKASGKLEAWKEYWQKEGSKIVHFIGKDIIYHHSLFWPAMLKAHGDYNLPFTVIAGEYLTLEGKKMSKSRGWIVGVEDYLKSFDPDPLRYYLTAVAPLYKDADFSWEEYARKNNDELADILGNFVHRSLTFTYSFFNKRVPKPGKLDKEDREMLEAIKETHQKVGIYLEQHEFHNAIRAIIKLSTLGNRYLNKKQPWKTVRTKPEKAATPLYIADQIVKALAILLEPFLPHTAEKIWRYLNLPGTVHQQKWKDAMRELPASHEIAEPKPLFRKLEPKTIALKRKTLREELEKTAGSAPTTISVEQFSKMDLRIGEIVDAESVPESINLIKLTIDVGGGEKRRAVAGIARDYTPKQLKGKQVAIIANLKPTKIFGIESQVMILAAEDGGRFVILQPETPVKTGSKIK